MRHADYRTTLKHYTVLGLSDTAAAIKRLPTIKRDDRQAARATGTDSATPDSDPQLYPQQSARETVRSPATLRDGETGTKAAHTTPKPLPITKLRDTAQHSATRRSKAGDETRTRNIQLGRLMLYQLSYARSSSRLTQAVSRAIRLRDASSNRWITVRLRPWQSPTLTRAGGPRASVGITVRDAPATDRQTWMFTRNRPDIKVRATSASVQHSPHGKRNRSVRPPWWTQSRSAPRPAPIQPRDPDRATRNEADGG